ncbi:MAG: DUF2341 domain-containing protein, partial [Patescibacteria group bacterium]
MTLANSASAFDFKDYSSNSFLTLDGSAGNITSTKQLTIGTLSGSGFTGDLQGNGGGSWSKWRPITVTTLADALPDGYSVKFVALGTDAAAIFSGSLPSKDDVRIINTTGTTTTALTSNITSTSTSIAVNSVTGFTQTGMVIIDSERIGYQGISGTTLQNCIRGSSGTTAASHTAAATVTTVQEMERYIETFTSSNVTIWFKLREDIATSTATSTAYRLYYGNSSATAAPSNGKNVYQFFDDFSTDTSANYVFSGTAGTKVYDAANGLLQQTSSNAYQYNLVHNSYLLPTAYVYQADVKITSDPQNRKHAGLLNNWLTTADTGNRATHLDAIFQKGTWLNGAYSEMTNIGDGGITPINTWVTSKIYRNSTSGLFRLWATNGVASVTVDNTTTAYTAGGIGLHSYGCVANYDNLKVRLWVDSDTIAKDGEFAAAGAEQALGMGSGLLAVNAGGTAGTAL